MTLQHKLAPFQTFKNEIYKDPPHLTTNML